MKRFVLLTALVCLCVMNAAAQDDDLYYTPSKKVKAANKAAYEKAKAEEEAYERAQEQAYARQQAAHTSRLCLRSTAAVHATLTNTTAATITTARQTHLATHQAIPRAVLPAMECQRVTTQ